MAPAKPVDNYKYESTKNDVIDTNSDPINSSVHSSPQNSNVTYANLPQSEHTVDDNANYAIPNDTKSPNPKALNRESSIKYVNDAEDEPVYYNEPPYYEQPGNSLRFNFIQKSQPFNIHDILMSFPQSFHPQFKVESTEINNFTFLFFL